MRTLMLIVEWPLFHFVYSDMVNDQSNFFVSNFLGKLKKMFWFIKEFKKQAETSLKGKINT